MKVTNYDECGYVNTTHFLPSCLSVCAMPYIAGGERF